MAQGKPGQETFSMRPKGLGFQHPENIAGAWQEMLCSDCHTGDLPYSASATSPGVRLARGRELKPSAKRGTPREATRSGWVTASLQAIESAHHMATQAREPRVIGLFRPSGS